MIRFKALRSSVYLKLYYIMTVFVCRQEVFFVHKTGLTKGVFEFLWNMDSMLYMIPVVIVLGLTGRRLTLAALFKCLLGYHIVNHTVVGRMMKMVAQMGETTAVIARVEVRVTSHHRSSFSC